MRVILETLSSILPELKGGERIFLYGEVGAGKTTLTQCLLSKYGIDPKRVKSPTYTYLAEYISSIGRIVHFDLYRLDSFETAINIGLSEIFDDPEITIIVEWPEILEPYYSPTLSLYIHKTENDSVREIYSDSYSRGSSIS